MERHGLEAFGGPISQEDLRLYFDTAKSRICVAGLFIEYEYFDLSIFIKFSIFFFFVSLKLIQHCQNCLSISIEKRKGLIRYYFAFFLIVYDSAIGKPRVTVVLNQQRIAIREGIFNYTTWKGDHVIEKKEIISRFERKCLRFSFHLRSFASILKTVLNRKNRYKFSILPIIHGVNYRFSLVDRKIVVT